MLQKIDMYTTLKLHDYDNNTLNLHHNLLISRSHVWLSKWSDHKIQAKNPGNETTTTNDVIDLYLGVYGAFGLSQVIFK